MYDEYADEPLECLDGWQDGADCKGPVELRPGLSPTGKWFPRCDAHWVARLERQEEIDRRYPATAPRDFDPYYAGESWDDY